MNTKPSFWRALTFILIAVTVALFIGYLFYTGERISHEESVVSIAQTYQI